MRIYADEPMGDRLERAARAAWTWAEEREQRFARARGRRYKPVAWEDAHDLDRIEYRAYIRVVAQALDMRGEGAA